MFGLMKVKKCGMTDEEKRLRRLHYCGTCKTMGALYGQKSRFLLNHDTVFLAEFLSALKGDEGRHWQKAYQSFNCLSLPKTEMPAALQFAATTNVILTEFKLADHLTDEGKRRYRFASNAFSEEFQKAEKLLRNWDFPLDEIRDILRKQESVEARSKNLDDFARPTAETTAAFFAHGVKLIGKEDLERPARVIGYNFGKLIYLLDALEDYEKDLRAGKFNAFRTAFDLTDEKIPAPAKRKINALLREIEGEIVKEIYLLPISEDQKNLFVSRLAQNLQRKLQTKLPVAAVKTKSACAPKRKQTFAEKWANARTKAKTLTRGFSWQMPLVFLFVFVVALVAPAQSKEAKSARECFDLSFNLMFLGSVFGSVIAFPKTILMQNLPSQENLVEKAERKRREGWCDNCDCCCDCGDGCCCCCDGCDCCGNCDCCSCDCN